MAIARRPQRPHITLLRRLRDMGTSHYTVAGDCKAQGPHTTKRTQNLRGGPRDLAL